MLGMVGGGKLPDHPTVARFVRHRVSRAHLAEQSLRRAMGVLWLS